MKRFQTWLGPASLFSVALLAVLGLVTGELLSDGEDARPRSAPGGAAAALVLTQREEPTPAPVAVEAAPPVSSPSLPAPKAVARAEAAKPEDPLAALNRMQTLGERLEAVEALKARLAPEEAIATLAGLLDADLPGTFYEAETLRICILGRLAELPGPRADAALIARIDPQKPRPQRLIAVEALAGRPAAGRNELGIIARNDHDTVVQERARWALAQAR